MYRVPFKSVIHYNITQRYTKCGPLPFEYFQQTDFRNMKKVGNLTNNYFTTIRTQYRSETRIIINVINFFTKM